MVLNEPVLPIVFSDVCYAYGQETKRLALNEVSLSVRQGEFVALVGSNGSGKSTLSKMVNALIVPDSGSVLTLGLDTSTEDDEIIFEIRSRAGLVLQNPDSQIVASIVSDDVAFGPENLAVPHTHIVERVNDALSRVNMTEYALADPSKLSGGQKQRVCIAGLLAMRPQVLVLDEPGAMLDTRGRRGIRRVLGELHAAGLTIVLVTHFMEEAALAERVIVLNKGKVLLQGVPREVFAQGPLLRDLGLDVPFSVKLAFALRSRGIEVPNIASPRELKEVLFAKLSDGCSSRINVGLNAGLGSGNNVGQSVAGSPVSSGHNGGFNAASKCGAVIVETKVVSTANNKASSADSPVVNIENLSFYYPTSSSGGGGKTLALDDVSLSLDRGRLLGVIGHTGSGKTTLLRILAGLLSASSGRINMAGVELTQGRKRPALHTKVGMVFQYPERQLFAMTVAEDVAFGPVNAGLNKEAVDAKVRAALAQMELDYEQYAGRSPFELSGGEKRRVAIAGMLAMDPEVLIFDEPTAGLDVQGQKGVQALINTLKAQGKTIILTSHSMDAIAHLSDTVAVLNKGKLAMLGSPAQVFKRNNEPQLKQINLGLPQVAEFARELGNDGLRLPEGLFSVEALADALVEALTTTVAASSAAADTATASEAADAAADVPAVSIAADALSDASVPVEPLGGESYGS